MLDINFIDLIESSIKENWEINGFTDIDGETYTFKEIAQKIAHIHEIYVKYDVKQEDKIAVIGRNSSNWAITFLATITYGAVIVPILPDFHPNDVTNIINHSDSILLFSSDQILETLKMDELENIKASILLSDFSEKNVKKGVKTSEAKKININNPEDIKYVKSANDKLMIISYTSGTTGFSKGVMLDYNSLVANVKFAQDNLPLYSGDKIVSLLPLAHSYGLAFEFLFPFTLGCHINFMTKAISAEAIIQAFETVKPKLILFVPLLIEKIYKKKLLPKISSFPINFLTKIPLLNLVIFKSINKKLSLVFGGEFKEVVIGGAALSAEVERFLKKIKFKFTIGYGMTECGPLISYSAWDKTKLTSAGKLIDYLEIKIDSNDPYNEVGEIMVKGENVMLGYYKNEEATKTVITEDGWLHTGDLGIIDKNNTIFIKGRSKSMILGPSGQNIYPEEIEATLNNMPYIQESVVIEREKRLIALVYPEQDVIEKEKLSEDDLKKSVEHTRKEVNKDLPKYMQLAKIEIHKEEFVKTPKKNIKRYLYQDS
ncbi:AMP-binding protein [Bacteroidota bacterium]